jgi:N-acetylmuramoyl-L-alanine amidase
VAAVLAAALLLSLLLPGHATAQEFASIVWKGETHPVALSGASMFSVPDAARALGFSVSQDNTTGVLTLSGQGHRVVVGAGTSEVPVDARVISISRAVSSEGATLFAPADFVEKVLMPLVGATGSYQAGKRLWALGEATPSPLSLQVAVVHVSPTTQVVLRQSVSARFVPTLTETGFAIRWPDQRLVPPFVERLYQDPFVAAVRFSADAAAIEFREPGLTARAYPLTGPDRLVIEVGRAAAPPVGEVTPPPSATPPILIVVDPGHGGAETGAIGPGGLNEKDFTLQLARRLASAIPRALACRVVLTRDSDSAISLDDRTAVANHEKASLFLSLHANSSRSAGAHGSETYYLSLEASDKLGEEVARRENQVLQGSGVADVSPGSDLDFILWDLAQSAHLKESSELAESIQEELNVVSRTENRGIKQAPFRVLVGATMPAVLVEAAFISNPEEEKKLNSAVFQQSVAEAIARALARFYSRRTPEAVRIALPTPTPASRAPTPSPRRP